MVECQFSITPRLQLGVNGFEFGTSGKDSFYNAS